MARERFARRVALKVDVSKIVQFRKVYLEQIIPVLSREEGLRRVYLLQSETDRSDLVSLTFWDSDEVTKEYDGSGRYQQNVARVKNLLKADPVLSTFRILEHSVGKQVRA